MPHMMKGILFLCLTKEVGGCGFTYHCWMEHWLSSMPHPPFVSKMAQTLIRHIFAKR